MRKFLMCSKSFKLGFPIERVIEAIAKRGDAARLEEEFWRQRVVCSPYTQIELLLAHERVKDFVYSLRPKVDFIIKDEQLVVVKKDVHRDVEGPIALAIDVLSEATEVDLTGIRVTRQNIQDVMAYFPNVKRIIVDKKQAWCLVGIKKRGVAIEYVDIDIRVYIAECLKESKEIEV